MLSHRVQVTSFGGSGTTALARHLQEIGCSLPAQLDWGVYKHRRQPPTADEAPADFRAIYLFSDPRDAVISVFARGIQVWHFWRMQGHPPGWEGPYPDALKSLESFVEAGTDWYGIEDHFRRWTAPQPYPSLCISHDGLQTAWPTIVHFLGLDSDARVFDWRPRLREHQAVDQAVRRGLDRIYGCVADMIDAFPSISTR
jgi:hypothetical protein